MADSNAPTPDPFASLGALFAARPTKTTVKVHVVPRADVKGWVKKQAASVRGWVKADGMSIKEVVRRTGLSRNTVGKYLRDENVEPRYRMSTPRGSRFAPTA